MEHWISCKVAEPAPPASPAKIKSSSSQIADALGPALDLLLELDGCVTFVVVLVVSTWATELGAYDQSSATMKGAGAAFTQADLRP